MRLRKYEDLFLYCYKYRIKNYALKDPYYDYENEYLQKLPWSIKRKMHLVKYFDVHRNSITKYIKRMRGHVQIFKYKNLIFTY